MDNQNREEKRILNIVNNLISAYKSLEYAEQFAYKNIEYQLDDSDKEDMRNIRLKHLGKNHGKRKHKK